MGGFYPNLKSNVIMRDLTSNAIIIMTDLICNHDHDKPNKCHDHDQPKTYTPISQQTQFTFKMWIQSPFRHILQYVLQMECCTSFPI